MADENIYADSIELYLGSLQVSSLLMKYIFVIQPRLKYYVNSKNIKYPGGRIKSV